MEPSQRELNVIRIAFDWVAQSAPDQRYGKLIAIAHRIATQAPEFTPYEIAEALMTLIQNRLVELCVVGDTQRLDLTAESLRVRNQNQIVSVRSDKTKHPSSRKSKYASPLEIEFALVNYFLENSHIEIPGRRSVLTTLVSTLGYERRQLKDGLRSLDRKGICTLKTKQNDQNLIIYAVQIDAEAGKIFRIAAQSALQNGERRLAN